MECRLFRRRVGQIVFPCTFHLRCPDCPIDGTTETSTAAAQPVSQTNESRRCLPTFAQRCSFAHKAAIDNCHPHNTAQFRSTHADPGLLIAGRTAAQKMRYDEVHASPSTKLLQSVGPRLLGSFWPLSKLAAARPAANIYQQLGVRTGDSTAGRLDGDWSVQAVARATTLLWRKPRVNLCFSKSCRKNWRAAIEAHRSEALW